MKKELDFSHFPTFATLRNVIDSVLTAASSILDTAPNRFQLLLKEAAHVRWQNPSLNRQLKHAELTLSFYLHLCFSASFL